MEKKMAYTQEDLTAVDDLIRLYSTGKAVESYEIRGRRIQYKHLTLQELQTLRRTIEAQLLVASGKKRLRYSLITTGKGL